MSVDRFIPAEPQTIFDLVADPAEHPRIDGSGTVKETNVEGPEKLSLGDSFSVDMKMGKSYRMTNTVVEIEEGRLIAWKPGGDYVWRYRFKPVEGGTIVTEEWDARNSKRCFMMQLLGFPRRNRRGITQTLERIHEIVAPS
ncbi:SRPBCC family protein [Corynebacterium sp. S7]